LNADIDRILEHEESKEFTFKRKMCKTLSGNNLWYLTVTSHCDDNAQKKKRGIVVTSRCHPGETNGSWMMRGFINFIVSSAEEAKLLRDNFIFKIVPMINPDGVINGNYRCSLAGKDLNRSWKDPNNLLHPEVY
jgi:murein tripeptide amidase MpaA